MTTAYHHASYRGDSRGTVSYFQAGGIDRPLVIWKSGVGNVVTHQNWPGQFARGTWGAGHSLIGQSSDCTAAYSPGQNCVPVPWPGWNTGAWFQEAAKPQTVDSERTADSRGSNSVNRQSFCTTVLIIIIHLVTACGVSAGATNTSTPPAHGSAAGRNSIVALRRSPPRDSVVLYRNDAMILLSMTDVEAYFAEWPLPSDMEQFRDEIRQAYAQAGWVALGDGMLEDLLAARLIELGRATLRDHRSRRILPWVRLAFEREGTGTRVVSHQLIYGSDGKLVLRVLHSVTIS